MGVESLVSTGYIRFLFLASNGCIMQSVSVNDASNMVL